MAMLGLLFVFDSIFDNFKKSEILLEDFFKIGVSIPDGSFLVVLPCGLTLGAGSVIIDE